MVRSSDVRRAVEAAGFAVAVASALGCTTLGKPAGQTIRIETPDCVRASCELSNDRGAWWLESAPGDVAVLTSKVNLVVWCRAGGEAVGVAQVAPSAKPTGAGAVGGGIAGGAAAGAAFGAALAIIPPLGVMAVLTGVALGATAGQVAEASQTSLRYPDVIRVPMPCPDAAAVAEAPEESLGFGLAFRGLPLPDARSAGLVDRSGVLVTKVVAGGNAAASGLVIGDIVVTAAGKELAEATDFEAQLRALSPGASLPLTVWREGRTVDLILTRPPEPKS
jgi:hypothetical protein